LRALSINVLAAYAPALLWVPWVTIGPGENRLLLLLFSPVALPMLIGALMFSPYDAAGGMALAWCLLAVFLLLLVAVSAAVHRSMVVTAVMAGFFFSVCLVQGLAISPIVNGLDSIGH
jgi:hypothetical protein